MINEEIQLNVEKLKTKSEYSCTLHANTAASCKLQAESRKQIQLHAVHCTQHSARNAASSCKRIWLPATLHAARGSRKAASEYRLKLNANTAACYAFTRKYKIKVEG